MNTPTATAAAGLSATAGTAALIAATSTYDLGASVVVGAAAGASVALVPGERGARKIAGFVTGVVVAAGAYVLRAGLLPDATMGAVLGVAAGLALLVGVALLTRGRTPLWASFAGFAAMAGAYEMLHILDFAGLIANLPIAAAGVLLSSAVGFTAASLFAPSRTAEQGEAVSGPAAQPVQQLADGQEPVLDLDLDRREAALV